jgi:hypothetical protein
MSEFKALLNTAGSIVATMLVENIDGHKDSHPSDGNDNVSWKGTTNIIVQKTLT